MEPAVNILREAIFFSTECSFDSSFEPTCEKKAVPESVPVFVGIVLRRLSIK